MWAEQELTFLQEIKPNELPNLSMHVRIPIAGGSAIAGGANSAG
jgi:hypothetical protein